MQDNRQTVRYMPDTEIIEATVFDTPKKYHEGMFIQFIDDEMYPAVSETKEIHVVAKCIQVELTVEPSRIPQYSQPLGEIVMYEMDIIAASGIMLILNSEDVWKKPVLSGNIGKPFGVTGEGKGKLRVADARTPHCGTILVIENIEGAQYVSLEFLAPR